MQVPKISLYDNKTNFRGTKEQAIFTDVVKELGLKTIKRDPESIKTFCTNVIITLRQRYKDSIKSQLPGVIKNQNGNDVIEKLHFINHDGDKIKISWGYSPSGSDTVFISYNEITPNKNNIEEATSKLYMLKQEALKINTTEPQMQAIV